MGLFVFIWIEREKLSKSNSNKRHLRTPKKMDHFFKNRDKKSKIAENGPFFPRRIFWENPGTFI